MRIPAGNSPSHESIISRLVSGWMGSPLLVKFLTGAMFLVLVSAGLYLSLVNPSQIAMIAESQPATAPIPTAIPYTPPPTATPIACQIGIKSVTLLNQCDARSFRTANIECLNPAIPPLNQVATPETCYSIDYFYEQAERYCGNCSVASPTPTPSTAPTSTPTPSYPPGCQVLTRCSVELGCEDILICDSPKPVPSATASPVPSASPVGLTPVPSYSPMPTLPPECYYRKTGICLFDRYGSCTSELVCPTPTPAPSLPPGCVIKEFCYDENICRETMVCPEPTPTDAACRSGIVKMAGREECAPGSFRYASFSCLGGYANTLGGDSSCKPLATWESYIQAECQKYDTCSTPAPTPLNTPRPTPTPTPPPPAGCFYQTDGICLFGAIGSCEPKLVCPVPATPTPTAVPTTVNSVTNTVSQTLSTYRCRIRASRRVGWAASKSECK